MFVNKQLFFVHQVVFCMDRCCDVSTYCPKFKLTKAECLAFLGRYQEAQEIAK